MNFKIDTKALVQKVPLEDSFLHFKVPFAMSITGPSQAGKSEFICKLIKDRENIFSTSFHRIIYCQPEILLNRENHIYSKIKIGAK
jgi:predicted AAA+ superfamily ATPase